MSSLNEVKDESLNITESANRTITNYGVAGSSPFQDYSKRVNVMLCDAVKAKWDSDLGLAFPTVADNDLNFLNTWFTGSKDIEIIFREGFYDEPSSIRSTDWRFQGVIDTVDVHVFVRGGGGDVEPPILNTVLNGLDKIIASNHRTLIPNARVDVSSTLPAPTENPDDLQTLWHVLMKVRVQYYRVSTV